MKSIRITTAVILLCLSGCANINPTEQYPVISKTFGPNKSDDLGEAIAIKANRRVVIVLVDGKGRYCAEPPPEISADVIDNFNTALKATKPGQPAVDLTLVRAYSESIRQLFKRSQGVQFFRDGMYSLCQAYVNHAISAEQFPVLYKVLVAASSPLIQQELDNESIDKNQKNSR